MNRLFKLLLLSVLLNSLLWIVLVPMWHFPDEQSHFGQVAYMAEKGDKPLESEKYDLTREIYTSEILLGTARDNSGNNQFTFHPEYRIEYTDSYQGKYEASISAMAVFQNRNDFIRKEATRYPVLYYLPAVLIYKIFYFQDIFFRVYAVRLWSVSLFSGTVLIIYLFAGLLFARSKLLQITLTLLVGFQPMMVFANTGVNSDSLGNLLFTLYLYLCTRMILNGMTVPSLIGMLITAGVAVYTKPQFILTVPLSCLLFTGLLLRDLKHKYKVHSVLLFIILSFVIAYLLNVFKIGPVGAFRLFFARFDLWSLVKFTKEYTISHTYSEVLPWYWGIYDWLGVTYPRYIHRTINWITLFSLIGIIKFAYQSIRNNRFRQRKYQAGIFLVLSAAAYFTAISFYDWLSWYTQGYQLGVQGRYFFPVISVISIMLLIGWREIIPVRFRQAGIKILGIMMIILNLYALWTVSKTYYDTSSVNTFIIQVSQYKPWFIKGVGFITLAAVFLSQLIIFLIYYARYPENGIKNPKKSVKRSD